MQLTEVEQAFKELKHDLTVRPVLNNLAQLLKATHRLAEAEPLMRRALAIDEAGYGAEHPDVSIVTANQPALLR